MLTYVDRVVDGHGNVVTDQRWQLVELGIKEFWKKYPEAANQWAKMAASGWMLHNKEYGLAKGDVIDDEYSEELKKAGWRQTISFPVIQKYNKETQEEIVIDSLEKFLSKQLPGLLAPDKPGKPNKLFYVFAKRFPIFVLPEKL
jgi:hypothetical protein